MSVSVWKLFFRWLNSCNSSLWSSGPGASRQVPLFLGFFYELAVVERRSTVLLYKILIPGLVG